MPQAGKFNPAERHVEKGVLGICAMIFIYGMFHWIFSSPRRFDVPAGRTRSEKATPAQVDENLLKTAKDIQEYMKNVPAEDVKLPDYLKEFENHQVGGPLRQLPPFVDVASARRPIILPRPPEGVYTSYDKLAKAVPPPQAPSVWIGSELPNNPNIPDDIITAHLAAIYPWDELVENCNKEIHKTKLVLEVVVLDVEAQVQQQQPDGTWGSAREVQTVVATPPQTATGRPTTPPEIPEYNGQNSQEIFQLIGALGSVSWQKYILQPPYWEIWDTFTGQWISWRRNLPPEAVKQITTSLTGRMPESIYEPSPGPVPAVREEPGPPEPPQRPSSPTPAPSGRGRGERGVPAGRSTGRPRGRTDYDVPEAGVDDYREPPRPTEMEGGDKPPPEAPYGEGPATGGYLTTQLPHLSEQMKTGKVLVWLHDTGLSKGKVYRYRIRPKLLNPLYAHDEAVPQEKLQDAYKKTIIGKWSPWSAPARQESLTEMFLTGSSPSQGTVNVTVFTIKLGQRHERNFTVSPGEAIGKEISMRVTDPRNGDESTRQVNFSTGAIVVDVDFDHRVINPEAPRQPTRPTVKMLYVDAEGKLHAAIRVSGLIADSPTRKRYELLMEQTRRKAVGRSGVR